MAKTVDLEPVMGALRRLMEPFAARYPVSKNDAKTYYLETRDVIYKKKPIMFGAVIQQKNYVAYHLLPLYMDPALGAEISPELTRRRQGKACFNFATIDAELLTELESLTKLCADHFIELATKFVASR